MKLVLLLPAAAILLFCTSQLPVEATEYLTLCLNRCHNYTLPELENSVELRTTRRLTVASGNVTSFDAPLIAAFGRLSYLEVWPQRSRSVDRFFVPPYLRTLILRRTGVRELDILPDAAYQLRVLYAADNRLTEVSQLHRLHVLQQLNLNNNKLRQLSWTAFDGLDELRELSLRGNGLRVIDGVVPGVQLPLRKLVRLNLSNNRLRRLDVELWSMDRLELLELEGNLLEQVGSSLVRLQALKKLSLRDNRWDCVWANRTLQWMEGRRIQLVGGIDFACPSPGSARVGGKLCCVK
ncbi:leucine-rich repeat-containing protein 15-like [Culex pipiens pallens]|uniref:leucine-rich repeat-containing protein 15-like n=1 Tax=Culex pipiens pallens TaxID=42434 RepID=UPI001952E0F7|nr:leucine-rich repeat-containing protein 15-like [Culex pipiens pallens]